MATKAKAVEVSAEHKNIVALLKAADRASGTRFNSIKQAATVLGAHIPASVLIGDKKSILAKDRVEETLKPYMAELRQLKDINILVELRAALIVLAVPDMVIEVKKADEKNGAVMQNAGEILESGNRTNTLKAAKQIRDAEGSGRKAGGGVKAKPAPVVKHESMLSVLTTAHKDKKAWHDVERALQALGYTLSKITLSKPKAKPARVNPLAGMVQQVQAGIAAQA